MTRSLPADSMMCAVCNGRAYGGGFFAAPEAQPDDGWLDVYIVRTAGRLTIAKLLGMYKNGRHFVDGQLTEEARPYFIYRRAKKVSLTPVDGRGPIVATADGECASIDQVDVRLCPLEGRILLPLPVYQRFMERPADVGIDCRKITPFIWPAFLRGPNAFYAERCFLWVSQIINKQIYQNPLIFHSEMSTILLALKQKEC